ncbi:S26 family signal peptidase [Natronomonas halophila]|uniref:S26 family signal peptidase n=1 Tax=Natronomonas halophila TaxID=2747817 RepID=UPI0015B3C7BA|nr:S26 family signal peptidase [Natronomonas halophila]QLD85840.1 S26 family signal peptidase [Natronomonas halophila]
MTDSEDGDRRGDGPSDVSGTDATDGTEDSLGPSEARTQDTEGGPSGVVDWLKWFWTTDRGWVIYLRDVTTSVTAVLVIGLLLFAISGIWPPMVAIESGSMEPHMERGDLVFVVDDDRFVPDNAPVHEGQSTGVLPADRAAGTGYRKFGGYGDVIVFQRDGRRDLTPVIHRAMLWVEDGENWYDRADPAYMGSASNCEQLTHCPAPHAGFITLGDANPAYDQHRGRGQSLSAPVKPEWVIGTAELKVPYLGQVRLFFSRLSMASEPAGQAAAEGPAVTGAENATAAAPDSPNATATAGHTRPAI